MIAVARLWGVAGLWCLLLVPAAVAQTHLGTDFWVAETTNLSCRDQFTIVVVNPQASPANVDIIHQSTLAVLSRAVAPGQAEVFRIPCRHIDRTGVLGKDMVYHVVSDVPVTVHSFNFLRNVFSTDATLILPTRALGKRYRVASYADTDGAMFGVVATEDDTRLEAFAPGASVPTVSVLLQTGEYYQHRMTTSADLTGWSLVSDKNVAAFSGHRCTKILGSQWCDHIEEQLMPQAALAASYVVCPTRSRPLGCLPFLPDACAIDLFRFVAIDDGTTLSVGSPDCVGGTIDAGRFLECETDEPHVVTADKPFYGFQYLISTSAERPPNPAPAIGDPALLNVVPVDQFLHGYLFLVPDTYSYDFINLAQPVGTALLLDGAPLPTNCDPAGMVGGVEYCCRSVPVADGTHTITGDQPFGLTVTGFDEAGSYAYPGGQALQPLQGGCDSGGPYRATGCGPVVLALEADASCSDSSPPVAIQWSSPDGVTFGSPTRPSTTATTPGGFGTYQVCVEVTCAGVAPVQCCGPVTVVEPDIGCNLAVAYDGYSARWTSGRVAIEWRTLREDGTIGFLVERAVAATGPWQPLAVWTSGRGSGAPYRIEDVTAPAGTRPWYRVVEQTIAGRGDVSPSFEADSSDASGVGGRHRDQVRRHDQERGHSQGRRSN